MPSRLVTLAEIAQIARVRPNVVHNWRRRYSTFPDPDPRSLQGNEYDESAVLEWLRTHKQIVISRAVRVARPSIDAIATLGPAAAVIAYWDILTALTAASQQGENTPTAESVRLFMGKPSPCLAELLSTMDDDTVSTLLAMLAELGLDGAMEQLTTEIAELGGRAAGEHVTSPAVRDLMVALAAPIKGSVLDPCAGSGSVLRAARAATDRPVTLVAADIDPAIGEAFGDLIAHGYDLEFHVADVLASDPFAGRTFDRIVMNPPYGQRLAPHVALDLTIGDMAWVAYASSHLAPTGRAVVVTPQAALVRSGADARLRQALLRENRVAAIVTTPGISAQRSNALAFWILQLDPDRTHVAMVDASGIDSRAWQPHDAPAATAREYTRAVLDALHHARPGKLFVDPQGVRSIEVPLADVRASEAQLLPARWLASATRMTPADASQLLTGGIFKLRRATQAANETAQGLIPDVGQGAEPEMVRWVVLEDTALFRIPGLRREQGESSEGVITTLTDDLGPATSADHQDATKPGEILFLPSGPRMGAVIDDTGGHLIAHPLIRIQVDHPSHGLTAEILCAWLNSPFVQRQAVGGPFRHLDLRTIEVPVFSAGQTEALTTALRAARHTARNLTTAATTAAHLPNELLSASLAGVTPQATFELAEASDAR